MAPEHYIPDQSMTSIFFLLLTSFLLSAQEVAVVFKSGTEGHKSYRIPAVIGLPDRQLLAFAEGRVNGSNDFGDINIVLKRSIDNGKTWDPVSTVVDYDTLQAGNPAPVVDLTDPEFSKGRIFLFYNTGNNHEDEVRKGKGYREVWYITSSDGGITWSDAVNITTQVHRPFQPTINRDYNLRMTGDLMQILQAMQCSLLLAFTKEGSWWRQIIQQAIQKIIRRIIFLMHTILMTMEKISN